MCVSTNEKNERFHWRTCGKAPTHIISIASLCTQGSGLGLHSLQIRKSMRRHSISQ